MIEIILDVVQIIVSTGIIVVLLKDRKCKQELPDRRPVMRRIYSILL